MTADKLREAAALMRELANCGHLESWTHAGHGDVVAGFKAATDGVSSYEMAGDVCRTDVGNGDFEDMEVAEHVADHIASWHPAVALAVADLLDAVAEGVKQRGVTARLKPAEKQAIAVALTYLGEQP